LASLFIVFREENQLYALNDDPQPQVDLTLGLSNLKPEASTDST
jgi:hypothetical protein